MNRASWQNLLTRWNAELLARPEILERVPGATDAAATGWLGYPPATASQIAAAEARIGKRLPPSYRAFLEVSNGWRVLGDFHWDILPTERIEWFRVNNQDWIDAYQKPAANDPDVTEEAHRVYGPGQSDTEFRRAYLDVLLEVSDGQHNVVLLLNPEVIFPYGEWEAWDFGAGYPGAYRYMSFWEMMREIHTSFLRLNKDVDLREGTAQDPRS
ncbi:MAG: SMI1/KNR4 family protein [Chloroflexota bacterium]